MSNLMGPDDFQKILALCGQKHPETREELRRLVEGTGVTWSDFETYWAEAVRPSLERIIEMFRKFMDSLPPDFHVLCSPIPAGGMGAQDWAAIAALLSGSDRN